jgi:hypothetical protein
VGRRSPGYRGASADRCGRPPQRPALVPKIDLIDAKLAKSDWRMIALGEIFGVGPVPDATILAEPGLSVPSLCVRH